MLDRGLSFGRVAIVNRGEAAMRFINAARDITAETGALIETIALYTDVDRDARFVREADVAHYLGPAPAKPYLDLRVLEQALLETRAEAAWVGWGFVAEDPRFAELCDKLGVTFIGPSASAMRALGDKIGAKRAAESVGVPVAPWSHGAVPDLDSAITMADEIGYPLMLKATAGGGGRGIRMIADPAELTECYERAKVEAEHAFGHSDVFLERLVTGARHVEVQVIADGHGTAWALGVRDCSIQRRNQKIIEESACPLLSPDQEKELKAAAERLVLAVDYQGAGTVEFLYQPQDRTFAFLEVNTRLQVEHTITEVTTGFDLVRAQVHVAMGGSLAGDPPAAVGHAVEARLNAEDPDRDFMPSPGRVARFTVPTGFGIRVDTGVSEGDSIPADFDSMIAKIIAFGRDRDEALGRLRRAMADTTVVIEGGATNKSFVLDLLDRPEVIKGTADTGWVDRVCTTGQSRHAGVALLAAAIDTAEALEAEDRRRFLEGRPSIDHEAGRPLDLTLRGAPYRLRVARTAHRRFLVRLEAGAELLSASVELRRFDRYTGRISVNGEQFRFVMHDHGSAHLVEVDDVAHRISRDEGGVVRAPSPALVVAIPAAPGAEVEAGAALIVLESMKMETVLRAPFRARVRECLAEVGGQVQAGTPLVRLHPLAGHSDTKVESGPDLAGLGIPPAPVQDDAATFDDLHGFLLGFDIDERAALTEYLTARRRHSSVAQETRLLKVFGDLSALNSDACDGLPGTAHSPRERFHRYLRTLDVGKANLPGTFRQQLSAVLGHYGVDSLDRTAALEEAVFRISVAARRDAEPVITAILRCWLVEPPPADEATRRVLEHVIAVTRAPEVRDLARSVHFRWFVRPAIRVTGVHPSTPGWDRLREFDRTLLPSREDAVTLVRCVARENPADTWLHASARTSNPSEVDLIVALCLDEIRHARSKSTLRRDRIFVHLGQSPDLTDAELRVAGERIREMTADSGLAEVVVDLRTDVRLRIDFEGLAGQVTIGEQAADPVPPLDDYRQKVLRARAVGAAHPYEVVDLLTGADGTFVEWDLDASGTLVPVDRPRGRNTAAIVAGVLSAPTGRHPQGVTRVVLFGDPTKSLGALSEQECVRVIKALDLAERKKIPLEWFTVSAGVRISMTSGTENLDWAAAVLKRIVEFTQDGGEVNIVVAGVNVGAQPYWNAEATMLMHTKGILVMTPQSTMVLTGKKALDFSGGVSAENNIGIGGHDRVMGPNGQAQYWAPDLEAARAILMAHYEHTYVAPGESAARATLTSDPHDRDISAFPHSSAHSDFTTVGEIFSETNGDRKTAFDIRTVMRAVTDQDHPVLERWASMADAESAVVQDAHIGGLPVCLIGVESHPVARHGSPPSDGPDAFTSGTLFPLSSKKVARAINAASGNRPLVVMANLSGFDGSPESLRKLQLEYGAEIGRAIVNFKGPIVLCVISRYHGGAFVVFSKALNPNMTVLAVEGAFASVIGGAPAAAVVFDSEVRRRAKAAQRSAVLTEIRNEVAAEFDKVHSIQRAVDVGSVDAIVSVAEVRPRIIEAITSREPRPHSRVENRDKNASEVRWK
ncbi:ATP-binding protein [Amycolatopsis japonica]